jgi:CTP:molybdopterin cytidylyltransferase MocA
METVAGLVLAAGAGRRYGGPKALVEVDGRLLVERALATLREAGCAPVVVVLGAGAAEVRSRADLSDATVVVNAGWAAGMGSSLRAGLAALEPTGAAAVAVLLVDTPGVTPAAVRLVLGYAGRDALVTATYQGEPGHPVLLGRAHWAGVAASAVGDIGARRYLSGHADLVTRVPCDGIADGADLDEPVA